MKEEQEPVLSLNKDDFEIEFLRGSGKGGQNRNKRETAVRIRHAPSGQEVYCCDERSQKQNLTKAFKRIAEKMKPWLKMETARKLQNKRDIEEAVNRSMCESNLKIEVLENGKWTTENK